MVGRIVVFARLCPISALISEKAVLLMLRPDLPDVSRTSKWWQPVMLPFNFLLVSVGVFLWNGLKTSWAQGEGKLTLMFVLFGLFIDLCIGRSCAYCFLLRFWANSIQVLPFCCRTPCTLWLLLLLCLLAPPWCGSVDAPSTTTRYKDFQHFSGVF